MMLQRITCLLVFCVVTLLGSAQSRVTQGEYFWDGDPGLGNGTALLATDGNFDQALERLFQTGIDVSSLSQGAHSFCVRVKGLDGNWSNTFRQTIHIDGPLVAITRSFNITQGEYFWDGDPGLGNGTALLATDGNFNQALEQLFQTGIDVSSLSLGAHSFCVRVKGSDGNWSNTFRQTIHIDGPLVAITRPFSITQGEYFWDGDPGLGNGTALLATDGNFNQTLEHLFQTGIDVSSLSLGAHSFSVRIKGSDGTWSNAFRQTIYIDGPLIAITRPFNITQGEYFWDGDPGQGNGTALLATDGNFNQVLEHLFQTGIDVSSLSQGAHSFSVRIKGSDGAWSNAFRQIIHIDGQLITITRTFKLTQGEYFWDTDPGQGNAIPLLATDGNFDAVLENLMKNNIDLSALSLGPHSFAVRVRGVDGSWSPLFKQTVFVECSSPTVPSVTIAPSGTNTCSGTSVQYTATVVNGGTAPVYTWKVNGTATGPNSSVFTSSTLVNGDILTCDLVSNSTCAGTTSVTSNSLTVSLTPSVLPTISISASSSGTICFGTPVTFNAVITHGGSSPAYVWKVNGSVVGSNNPAYASSALQNGDVVLCELTSNETCAVPSVVTSTGITMNVSNIVTPTISIVTSSTAVCTDSTTTFTANASGGGSSPVYQWKINGNNVGTNANVFSSATLSTGDVVSCELTSSLNCVTTSSAVSNNISMTVNPTVSTEVTITSNAGSTICSGTSVTFTAVPVNGGTPAYQWMLNGLPVGTNSNTFSSTTLNNGDIVTCNMTSSLACPTPAVANSNSITMTVNNGSAPTASIVSDQGSNICTGTNVIFTASVTNGGSTPVYQWMLNGNPVGTNSPTYSNASLLNGNAISCVITSNSICVDGTMATSNTITMSVSNMVTPAISVSASETTICAGMNVTFSATATNQGTTPTYQWTVNGSNAGTNSNTFSSTTLNNGDLVSCTLTSSLNCVTTSSVVSNSIPIEVNPVVTTSVSISSDSGPTICAGTSVTFTAVPTNGGTPVYQWKRNGSPVGTNNSTYLTSSLNNGDVITCDMTSSLICPNSATVTSNSISMTVNSISTPTVAIVSSEGNSICSGVSVVFTATSTNGGSSPGYQWMLNGSPVGTNSSVYTNSTLTDTDVVNCVLTSNAPCPTTLTAISNTITMTVNSAVSAGISISASSTNICSGTAVIFTAVPANGGTPVYQWQVNGSNVGTNSNTFTSSILTDGATVTCFMTSSLGCVTPTTVLSNGITMDVISINAGVTVSGNTLTAIQTGVTYQWINCENGNTPISGATAQIFTPTADGTYAVVITNAGCTETSDCILVTTVGVEKPDQNNWNVYPNPTSQQLNVTTERAEVIQITDVSGKIVTVEQLQTGNNIINVSSFSPGVYFIQSIFGGAHVKFVKNN